jgi:hypothetical protein
VWWKLHFSGAHDAMHDNAPLFYISNTNLEAVLSGETVADLYRRVHNRSIDNVRDDVLTDKQLISTVVVFGYPLSVSFFRSPTEETRNNSLWRVEPLVSLGPEFKDTYLLHHFATGKLLGKKMHTLIGNFGIALELENAPAEHKPEALRELCWHFREVPDVPFYSYFERMTKDVIIR